MSIVFDLITVLILAGSSFLGYKKGIIDVGFKVLAIVVSLVLSFVLYSPITNLIVDNTEIDETIANIIIKNGVKEKEEKEETPSSIETFIQNYAKDIATDAQNNIVEAAARPIAIKVVGICVLILLYIIIRIGLYVLQIFTDILAKLPILKQCNEIVGLAYGIIRGLIVIYAVLAIVALVTSVSSATTVNTAIEESFVTKFFYDYNLLLML